MKMRFEAMFYCNILLCVCICVSYGAPPKEVEASTSNTRFQKYTEEEDKLIVDELACLLDKGNASTIWNKITEKHNEKWEAKASKFPQERSISSIRNRFWGVLIHNHPHIKVKVPEIIKNNINNRKSNKKMADAGSNQSSSVRSRLNKNQATNEQLDEDLLGADTIDECQSNADVNAKLIHKYTEEEDNFIIDEISSFNDDIHIHSRHVWEKIAAGYRKKSKEGTPGFLKARTASGLYNRFRYHLIPNHRPNKVKVPDSLKQKFIQWGKKKGSKPWYTQEEDKFIIEELLKPTVTYLYGSSTLKLLRAKHDKKREAKIPGFEQERTACSLGGRIAIMKNSGLFPKAIEEKFSKRQKGASSGETSYTHRSKQTYAQNAEMIEELLNNTEYEVDFSHFFSQEEAE